MKKTRFKELLAVALGNIVSGIFFGTGCILIEHADNLWLHPETAQDESESETNTTATSQPKSIQTDEQIASND